MQAAKHTRELLPGKLIEKKFLKRVVVGALACYVVRMCVRLLMALRRWNKSKTLAMRLPTAPIKDEAKSTLNFFGWMKQTLPDGVKLNASKISKHFVTSIQKVHEEHAQDEGLICLWTFNPRYTPVAMCYIVVWDMDIARELTSAKLLPKMLKGAGYDITAAMLGKDNIAVTSHEVWHPQRLIIERAFTTEYVNKQTPIIKKTAQELIQKLLMLHQNEADSDGFLKLDISKEVKEASLDVIGRFAFSHEIGALNNSETGLLHDFKICLDIIEFRHRNPLLHVTRNILPTKQNRTFNKSLENISKVILDMIALRTSGKKQRETNDLLDILLESYVGEGVDDKTTGKKIKLNKQQIVGNIKTVLFGGHETMAATMSWLFFLLAKHPYTKQKILDEFQENNHDMSPEKLEGYSFLNAVVIEVLRLYPSGAFLKQTTEDVTVGQGKYVIPEGVDILFLPYLQQRDPKNFERPDEFLPERWLDTSGPSETINFSAQIAKMSRKEAFFPFSLGARNCVGRKLVLLEIKIFVLEMISAFDMSLPEKMPEEFQEVPYLGNIPYPKAVELHLKPRSHV